jgi:hypothetical protein
MFQPLPAQRAEQRDRAHRDDDTQLFAGHLSPLWYSTGGKFYALRALRGQALIFL